MTSTSFNVGLTDTRNSSKVLKPPGGGSSDIFGTSAHDPEPHQRKTKNHLTSSIFGGDDSQTPARKAEATHVNTNGEKAETTVNGSSSASSTASTPASAPAAPAPTAAAAPARQRVPPGGFSSGLW